MGQLEGKSAVVTGGANGIGRAVVSAFVAEGARVAILDCDEAGLESLAVEHGDAVIPVAGRVETLRDNQRVVEAATAAFGRLDIFVGNVGVGAGNLSLVDIPADRLEEAIDEIYAVNVKAYLLGARASIGPLLETGGNMVFSCSIASYRAVDDGALYVSSKHADLGIVRGLAWEFAPKVRVNGVAIGVARTKMMGLECLNQPTIDAVLPGAEQVIPLGFIPEAADYGQAFVYLASDASRVVTGECLWADSGFGIRGIGRSVGGSYLTPSLVALPAISEEKR